MGLPTVLCFIVKPMSVNKQNPYGGHASQQPGQQGGFVPARPAQPRHANPYSANPASGARPQQGGAQSDSAFRGASRQNVGRSASHAGQQNFGARPRYSAGSAAQGGPAAAADASEYSRARYGSNMGGGKHGRNDKSGKRRLWTVVLVIAALVLAVSLGVLGVIGYGYWHGTKVYDDISATSGLAKEETALADMTVNWDALREQNEDIVGWVYMPGTSIDYPIVQGENDEEYLQKDFTGSTSGLVHKGTIFLSADNAGDFSDSNSFIYGHNMNDETMFAHILAMTDQATFDAARTFYILTPTQNYRCRTYALDVVKNTETNILQPNFADEAAMRSYMTARINDSAVGAPTDVDLASVTKLFTLITCGDDYANTRAVLCGDCVEQAAPANAE